jgi:hypothetical protein
MEDTENAYILFENFENRILEDKFIFIMSNEEIQPFLAKTLYNMFYRKVLFAITYILRNHKYFSLGMWMYLLTVSHKPTHIFP